MQVKQRPDSPKPQPPKKTQVDMQNTKADTETGRWITGV